MAEDFTLHPDLARDGVEVVDLPLSRLLLMDDATYPWLILVPQLTGKRDFHDLAPAEQYRLCDEITLVSEGLGRLCAPDKMNVAALGNMTPQLHVHVIARFRDDPAWPGPVWGKVPRQPYAPSARELRVDALRAALEGR
jgi:diadenosine tetraphosphate (Ap4A) HIT family hydrolase